MVGLALRLAIFVAWFCLVALVTATATAWCWSFGDIGEAQLQEEQAISLVGFADPAADEYVLNLRDRSLWSQDQVTAWVGSLHMGKQIQSDIGRIAASSLEKVLPEEWWVTKGRPHLLAFVPTLAIRLEVFLVVFMLTVPVHAVSFWIGEYFSRQKIREGAHKRNSTIRAALWILRAMNTFCAVLVGLVATPPVVFWVALFVVVSISLTTLIRANFIELR
jgi:hypothetical protein